MRISTSLPFVLVICGCAVGPHRVGGANQLSSDEVGDTEHNLLQQSNFDDGVMLPWMSSFDASALGEALVKDGALCTHIEKGGKARWDVQVRHRAMVARRGHHYTLSFKAWASRKTKMTGKFGMSGAPYKDYWTKLANISTEPQQYAYTFDMVDADDPTVELAFHLGGAMIQGAGPIDVCFDDVVLSEPDFTPPPKAAKLPPPNLRVNQIGYLPKQKKIAALLSAATEPLEWKLLDGASKEVASGRTQPQGVDEASGDSLHLVDFSNFQRTGTAFMLAVGKDQSDPFAIADDLYRQLEVDAFKYFYHNRSGVEIVMPYAGGEQWTRAAGHPKDTAKCAPDAGCDYRLDVTGGWYDAGDHGKYVVNGGIAVWTLMNRYERATHMKRPLVSLGDATQLIPESGNGVPDVLDEARWELQFLLAMQVPEGQPHVGMVHHKMHDVGWTGLGLAPGDDAMERTLRPVSTAATLNLVAVAAQASRIWKTLDPVFSKRCLLAAEKGWAAAAKSPAVLASPSDNQGGGAYDDSDLRDEFYWAAAELFLTTRSAVYEKAMQTSPLDDVLETSVNGEGGGTPTAMTWQRVDTLGKISLAIVPNPLGAAKYQRQITSAADVFDGILQHEGYRQPLRADKAGRYPWGSNSFLINNALVLALAHDFTGEQKYMDGVVLAMDYVLGRNAMAQSYVTGYGTRPLRNPHHRFWAHQASPAFPPPPPGAVSGGPNSSLQDPYVKAAGLSGCAPQKCFVDHIEAWSTNEVTINWNAPLSWVIGWVNEHGD